MDITTAGYIMASIFALGGSLSIAAAICNWDWFFRSESVRMLTWRLSRHWQRAVYAMLGIAILAMAIKLLRDISAG